MTNKEVYQRCLELINSDEIITHYSGAAYVCKKMGVCDLLFFLKPGSRKKDFPEWFEQNPDSANNSNAFVYWWPLEDRESRRLALLEALKLCDNATVHP